LLAGALAAVICRLHKIFDVAASFASELVFRERKYSITPSSFFFFFSFTLIYYFVSISGVIMIFERVVQNS